MKLWHDDTRPAPDGWVWARTNREARRYLRTGEVTEISLDHDLGLHKLKLPEDPDDLIDMLQKRGQSKKNGLDLVKWMCKHHLVPETVIIHSWSDEGARNMADYLTERGYDCTVVPFVLPK